MAHTHIGMNLNRIELFLTQQLVVVGSKSCFDVVIRLIVSNSDTYFQPRSAVLTPSHREILQFNCQNYAYSTCALASNKAGVIS